MSWREAFPVNQNGITSQFISSELDLGQMQENHAAVLRVEGTATAFTIKLLGRWASSGNTVELASVDDSFAALPFTTMPVIAGMPVRYLRIQVDVTAGSLDLQAALSSEM